MAHFNNAGWTAARYLELPYLHAIVPQEDGWYLAEIVEFPGCVAIGSTADEAYRELLKVAESWVDEAIRSGLPVPLPLETDSCGGRVDLSLPRGLHRRAAVAAQREGTSLNQYLMGCIAHGIGAGYRTMRHAAPDRSGDIRLPPEGGTP